MKTLFRKTALAAALGATALTGAVATATPAMADPYYHRGHGDVAGAAVAGGVIGLALGAIIASSSHHDRRYDRDYNGYSRNGYYNNGYYNNGYYNNDYYRNDRGYYQNRDGYRYDHDGRPWGYDRDR